MTTPAASKHIPDVYWTDCLEPALEDSIKEFNLHKDHVAKDAYIEDFTKCLVSFGIRQVGSNSLISHTMDLAL